MLCFRDLNKVSCLLEWLDEVQDLCFDCRALLVTNKSKFKVADLEVVSLFPYQDLIQQLLIRYKESKDIALHPLFLGAYRRWFLRKYRQHLGILVPSHPQAIARRGFNHLPLIFQNTIPLFDGVVKTSDQQQMRQSKAQRPLVNFELVKTINPSFEKLVILDDVITTGASLRAMSRLFSSEKYSLSAFSIAFHPMILKKM